MCFSSMQAYRRVLAPINGCLDCGFEVLPKARESCRLSFFSYPGLDLSFGKKRTNSGMHAGQRFRISSACLPQLGFRH